MRAARPASSTSHPSGRLGLLPLGVITGACATGYDRHGWLCKRLTLPEIAAEFADLADATRDKFVSSRERGVMNWFQKHI